MKNFFEDKFFIFGHRGFSEVYPENTMASFEACALNPSVDGVELDVHLCKSGEVVVCHDFSLKRTAGIDREVEDLTFDELKNIDVGSFKDRKFSNARIPLLEDLFKTFGSRFYYDIEFKVKPFHINPQLCRKTYELILEYNLADKVMVSSFNPFALRHFTNISNRKINTADIFCDEDDIPKLLRWGNGRFISLSSYLKPKFNQISPSFCKKVGNIPIITWTVNTEEEAQKILKMQKEGCNIRGLIGNNPQILAKTLENTKF